MRRVQSNDSKEQLAQKAANEKLAKSHKHTEAMAVNKKTDGPNRPST